MNNRHVTTSQTISIYGLTITLIKKHIKNVYFRVYPPDGKVLVSAPLSISEDELFVLIKEKQAWIKKQQLHLSALPAKRAQCFVDGEIHFFQGKEYRLRVIEHHKQRGIEQGCKLLLLFARPNASTEYRQRLLYEWYREKMKALLPELIKKYEARMGVKVKTFGVRQMKTRWGSCNPSARRIWLNLDLIKMPVVCLEYVVVHEMVHLFERYHNARFKRLMNKFMPEWQSCEKLLCHFSQY